MSRYDPESGDASNRMLDYSKMDTAELIRRAWDPKNCDLECLRKLHAATMIKVFTNDFDDEAAELILFLDDKIRMIESQTEAAAVMEMFLKPETDMSIDEQAIYMMERQFED